MSILEPHSLNKKVETRELVVVLNICHLLIYIISKKTPPINVA